MRRGAREARGRDWYDEQGIEMTGNPDIFIVGAARSAIGSFGGALKDVPLAQLATTTVRAALERSGVEPASVGHVVLGNVVPTEPRDAYLARVAAIEAGIPHDTPAFNVNRLCGAGCRRSCRRRRRCCSAMPDRGRGRCRVDESGPYFCLRRAGARAWATRKHRLTLGALHDPFDRVHMGMTAENVAARRASRARCRTHSRRRAIARGAGDRRGAVQGRDRAGRVPARKGT